MNHEVSDLIAAFSDLRVLVLGEAMLDSYLKGSVQRLCQEAPVPVLDLANRDDAPGGAANTAVNVSCLGAQVEFLSVIGDDYEGELLCQALAVRGVLTTQLLTQPQRRTLAKQRLVADSQLLLRLDQGSKDPINATSEQALLDRLAALWQGCDAVVVSDYCYGILTPRIIQALTQWQGLAPRPLVVDARQLSAYREVGVTAVKPNYQEALQLLGELSPESLSSEDFSSEKRVEQITAHGPRLLELTGARLAAISLDRDGALIFEPGHPVHRTYAPAVPEAHPAGAGDTFVSAFTLALAAGAAPSLAADLASAAAAVVVAQAGTTACSGADLQSSLELLNRSLR